MFPVSRESIREALHHADPLTAVFELARIWSQRPDRKETDPCFGLLPCQYAVHLYLNYEADVGNGGHAQYFSNPVGAHANATLDALQDLNLPRIYSILTRAVGVFPRARVPADWRERNAIIDGFPEHVFKLWGELDRELWSLGDGHWRQLQRYLQAHESEILERDGS